MDASQIEARKARARTWFERLRDDICAAFETLEDDLPAGVPFAERPAGRFVRTPWSRIDHTGGQPISGLLEIGPSSARSAKADPDCGGGVMSILLARLVHAWNMVPKSKESLTESPAVTAKRFHYDELVFDPAAIRFVIATFGESQIMIGTDYPFALGDMHPMKTLELAQVRGETLVAISSGNAKRFLGL